jgi:hypothetical protein
MPGGESPEVKMRKVVFTALALLISASANAFEITDGSGQEIDPALLKTALSAEAALFHEPATVEFRNIKSGRERGTVCGELNPKGSANHDVGFMPFGYTSGDQITAFLDPRSDDHAAQDRIGFWLRLKGCLTRKQCQALTGSACL